jgi:Xaa-Pro aminopeptidase
MDEWDLHGIVATTAENVRYFSGVESVALEMFPHTGQCYVVLARDRLDSLSFITSRCEIDQVLDAFPTVNEAVAFGNFHREVPSGTQLTDAESRLKEIAVDAPLVPTALEALVTVLGRLGLSDARVGVDEAGVPQGYLDRLAEALPHARFIPAAGTLRSIRKVKTPSEVRRAAEAAKVVENAIVAASAIVREGVRECDVAREFERSIASQGGRPKFTLIRFGRNAVAGQVTPDDTPLRRGDTIWFDVGCTYRGYWADIARVYSLGEPEARARRIYQAMLEGENRAIAEAHPGMSGKELFDITVEAVREAGVPHYRRHHVGHGIGVEAYDPVLITGTNEDVLEEDTIVNIETPYYEFGLGALHVEDPFVVRSDGNTILTRLSRDLHVID